MAVAELQTLIDDIYKFISETLASEKLSSSASAARESLRHRIHLVKGAPQHAGSKAEPAAPHAQDVEDLPEYGDAMPEYEEFASKVCTVVVAGKEGKEGKEASSPPPSPTLSEEVTVSSLVGTAVMHGILHRWERKFIREQRAKCWAAATPTAFHLFNSETEAKPVVSLRMDEPGFEVRLPPPNTKDSKKKPELQTFEVFSPSNKPLKLSAPTMDERQRWLTVLNQGVPFSSPEAAYENHSTLRSLPETPLDRETSCEKVEEDTASLDNYEVMGPGQGDDEDIYDSLENVASLLPHPHPPNKPSLPANKPPRPTQDSDEDFYDDTAAVNVNIVLTPQIPDRAHKPPLVRNLSTLHSMASSQAAAAKADYAADEDAAEYWDIADLAEQRGKGGGGEEEEAIYDDTTPLPTAVTTVSFAVNNRRSPSPQQEEYDEVGPAHKPAPPPAINKPASFLFKINGVQTKPRLGPPAPPRKPQPPKEEEEEVYDEVGTPPQPPPPPSKQEEEEVYDEVGAPAPPPAKFSQDELASKLKLQLQLKASKPLLKPSGPPPPAPTPDGDLSNANTVLSQLAKLKKVTPVARPPTAPTGVATFVRKPSVNKLKPNMFMSQQPAETVVVGQRMKTVELNASAAAARPPPPNRGPRLNGGQNIFLAAANNNNSPETDAATGGSVKDLIKKLGKRG